MRIFDDLPVGEASAPTWPVNAVSEHAAKRVATRSLMLFFLSVVCSIALFLIPSYGTTFRLQLLTKLVIFIGNCNISGKYVEPWQYVV